MHGYPTILVAGPGNSQVIEALRQDGYLVLEADDWEQVLDTVKRHSRSIHLLLGPRSMELHAPLIQRHRSELLFYFVGLHYDEGAVLATIKQLVAPPARTPAHANLKHFVKAS